MGEGDSNPAWGVRGLPEERDGEEDENEKRRKNVLRWRETLGQGTSSSGKGLVGGWVGGRREAGEEAVALRGREWSSRRRAMTLEPKLGPGSHQPGGLQQLTDPFWAVLSRGDMSTAHLLSGWLV